jgi:hypothetical protein
MDYRHHLGGEADSTGGCLGRQETTGRFLYLLLNFAVILKLRLKANSI